MIFSNLGIKKKLVVSFLVIAVLSALSSGYAVLKIMDMRDNTKEITDNWLPSVSIMGWLNGAVSDVQRLALGITLETDPKEIAKLEAQLHETLRAIEQKRKVYEGSLLDSHPEERQLYENFSGAWSTYLDKLPALLAAGKENNFTLVNQRRVELVSIWARANNAVAELAKINETGAEKACRDSLAAAQSAYIWVSIFAVSITAFAVVVGWLIAHMIANPLIGMVDRIQQLADGNLAIKHIEVTSQDEVGKLGASLNTMTASLRGLIKQISHDAEQLAASSEELTANSEQSAQAAYQVAASITKVADGSSEALAASNEASAVVEQMSAGIQQVASNANIVAAQSALAADKAIEGDKTVEKAINQMAQIEETVNTSAVVVAKLGNRSQEVGQIVDTISGIASQTNLLALNAAIEAARAGDQGRGFAVVAEEVRQLAEQSQEAAKKIAQLIGEIQGDTSKAVVAMNDGTREVKIGAEAVNAAGAAFREIVGLVSQISSQIREISAAIQQMASGSRQIVGSVKKIDVLSKTSAGEAQSVSAATEEQLASMEEIATASQALAKLAQDLQEAVARFRV